MATKREDLKNIIDSLPEELLPSATEFLKSLIPEDDEPLTEEELKQIVQAKEDIKNGEYVTLEELLKELEESQ